MSLDAPAIAAAWALLFARARHVAIGRNSVMLLTAAVWFVYVADRLLDGWTENSSTLRARHFFYSAHKNIFVAACVVTGMLGLFLAHVALDAPQWRSGVALGSIVAIYLVSVHVGRSMVRLAVPKEVFVGILFAAGTTLPLWSEPGIFTVRGLIVWSLFAVLCVLNCVAIEMWESGDTGVASGLVQWAGNRFGAISGALTLMALTTFVLRDPHRSSGQGLIAIGIAAFLMLLLDQRRAKLSAAAMRVLADAALFAPACIVLLIHHL